jgi:hypothetical protein
VAQFKVVAKYNGQTLKVLRVKAEDEAEAEEKAMDKLYDWFYEKARVSVISVTAKIKIGKVEVEIDDSEVSGLAETVKDLLEGDMDSLSFMKEFKELEGWDLTVFSYGHCPFCDADISLPDDDVVTCEICGTTFYLICDENLLT